MKKIVLTAIALLLCAGSSSVSAEVFRTEPQVGDPRVRNRIFYVEQRLDGRTCPKGQVTRVTPANPKRGINRTYSCVPAPK